ncbi:hypothetical protein ABW20_dc0102670 [Dactylellina cionopaga]|nr:hypothetical protein ABW20_dc0102670 [Dactylellina cionopaga]
MKCSIATLAILASSAIAAPIVKKADIDLIVLQFALTLEHLENVFYKSALSMMPESDFIAAGYTPEYYSNLKYIAHDEEAHVKALTDGITAAGGKPVAACEYAFPFTDVKSFVGLSSILEGVGTSAYLGGAPLITSKDYLTIAGSILVTEALHTSMQRAALGRVPAGTPYGTPLSPSPVYTLAAAFIKSCPSTNMALPFKAFPALTAVQGMPASPGMPFEFSVATAPPAAFWVTFVNGLDIQSVAPSSVNGNNFMVTPPATFGGQAYALITSSDVTGGPIADSAILFGPAILEFTPNSPTFDISLQK